jgi:S-adenosylmethionine hydrolase
MVGVRPVINDIGNQLIGSVTYIDNFGNVVTNIKKADFLELQKMRPFTIFAQSVKFNIIYNSYVEAINYNIPKEQRNDDGKLIALWNSANHLELSIYKSNPSKVGSANSLFGLDFRTPVTVKFN